MITLMNVTLPRAGLPVFRRILPPVNSISRGSLSVGLAFLLILALCAEPIHTEVLPATAATHQGTVLESSVAGALTLRHSINLATFSVRYLPAVKVSYRSANRTCLNGQSVTNHPSLAARGTLPVSNGNRLPLAVNANPPQFVYLC